MGNSISLINNLQKIDWDFANFSNEGLNAFHWYPATFISAIPGSLIPILSEKGDTVLDTFCGTGVTGYESIRLGRKFIGVDNNPIAILISKAKLTFPETTTLKEIFTDFFADPFLVGNNNLHHPNQEVLRKWYHSKTYNELLHLLYVIRDIKNPNLRIPAQALFSSILKKTSSQSRHWGWVCDNVVPKSDEIVYKSAADIFSKTLNSYCDAVEETLNDIRTRNVANNRTNIRQTWDIECSDTIERLQRLENSSIDLIHTSPPYYGVADYVKAQRLSFLWFAESIMPVQGFSFSDFEQLRGKETGARSKRHGKDSFNNFMLYMKRYVDECHRVLKHGSYYVLIVGDSKTRTETISPLEEYILKSGFEKSFDFQRQIKESRRRLMAKVSNEQIKIYRKM